MTLTASTPVPDLETELPDPTDRVTYGTRGRAMWSWLKNILQPGINAIGEAAYQNALDADDSAVTAASAPGFVGRWADQTGAATVPTSVHHSNDYWILLEDVPDITAVTPGVSAVWASLGLVRRAGDTMTGHLVVPAGATGSQVPRAEEVVPMSGGAARLPSWTTAGRPASPSAGDTGFNTTLGTEETYNGTAWVPRGWQVTSVSASGSTSHTFTLPSWANEFRVGFFNVSTDGTGAIIFRLLVGGVIESSGYQGFGHLTQASSVSNGTAFSSSFSLILNAATSVYQGVATFQRRSGSNVWAVDGDFGRSDAAVMHSMSGSLSASGVVDAVQITASSGNLFDAGTIFVSYRA